MNRRFVCPWLDAEIELTAERERHIARKHRELLPAHRDKIAEVLADPDVIQQRPDSGASFPGGTLTSDAGDTLSSWS